MGTIIYKEWGRNRKKFQKEYSEILKQLEKVVDSLEYWNETDIDEHRHDTRINPFPFRTSKIKDLIEDNPKKVEGELIEDWKKTYELIKQLRKEYFNRGDPSFSKDEFYVKHKKALKKARWLKNKVDNYYTRHFHRRLWYRVNRLFK